EDLLLGRGVQLEEGGQPAPDRGQRRRVGPVDLLQDREQPALLVMVVEDQLGDIHRARLTGPHAARGWRVDQGESKQAGDLTEDPVKRELNPKMLYFGTPVILVSSLNADGTTNIAPMSSAWWVGQTAMLGLSVNSQTVRNLEQRPACVLNLVDGG